MPKPYLLGTIAALILALGVCVVISDRTRSPSLRALSVTVPVEPARETANRSAFENKHEVNETGQSPDVIAKAKQTLARSDSTQEEIYFANYDLLLANQASGNQAEKRRALQGMIDSDFLSSDAKAALERALIAIDSQ